MNASNWSSMAASLVADFQAAEPIIKQAVATAEPTVEAALEAAVSAYNPALGGAAKFAIGLAKLTADYVGKMEAIKAASPNVPADVWSSIADGNIADDAAIMALAMPGVIGN
jgi:hypothetical protein